ncbi:MAG: exodeoxyribonuclease VII large subunit, partial [Rhodobacteraceae bacterium]
LARLSRRLQVVAQGQVARWQARLEAAVRLQDSLGYKATLARGYAVVYGDGALVTTRAAASGARALEIEFADGKLAVGARTGARGKSDPPEQGSLF